MNKEIKNIIWDLGGVLIDWDPRYLYRKVFETEEAVSFFLKHVCTFDWNEMQDGGRPIAEANAILSAAYPEYQREIELFYHRWEEMLGGAIQDSLEILEEMYQIHQYRIVALTNWSAETWPVALREYSFLSRFEGILVSGQEDLKKPDPAIYQLLMDRYSLSAGECLFIDDNLRNIEAATALGIHGLHFQNSAQLRSELIKLEILKDNG